MQDTSVRRLDIKVAACKLDKQRMGIVRRQFCERGKRFAAVFGEVFCRLRFKTVYLAQDCFDPIILIDCGNTLLELGKLIDLIVIQSDGFADQLAVSIVRQAQNDFRVGVPDHSFIKKSRRLIGDDKAFSIGAHLGNRVCQHFNRLSGQISADSALHG